jgi:hypothetical protein
MIFSWRDTHRFQVGPDYLPYLWKRPLAQNIPHHDGVNPYFFKHFNKQCIERSVRAAYAVGVSVGGVWWQDLVLELPLDACRWL